VYRDLVGNLRGKNHLEDVGRKGRIILYEILRKLGIFEDNRLFGCDIMWCSRCVLLFERTCASLIRVAENHRFAFQNAVIIIVIWVALYLIVTYLLHMSCGCVIEDD
jgi:hypothetical protein